MSRKGRIIYEGAIYHIYQRGNNKEYIFQDDKIKAFIIKYLKEYNKKFDYELLAYVIMDNHYHLLIRTNKSPIDQIMFYLNNLLGKHIKSKLNRTGHAFDSRYKCKLIDTDSYLIWLVRYIHRNPKKANICSELESYRWSSHYLYINNVNSNINKEFILRMLGNSRETSVKRYLELVNSSGDEIDKEKDYEIIKGVFNLEETSFSKHCVDVGNSVKLNRQPLAEIISLLNVHEDILNDIRNGSRKQSLTPIKVRIIEDALDKCYSLKEIANYLNAAPSTVSKLISRNKIV